MIGVGRVMGVEKRVMVERRRDGLRVGARVRTVLLFSALWLILGCLAGVSGAWGHGWWNVGLGSRPSALVPGADGVVVISVANVGDAGVTGSGGRPIDVSLLLPAGVKIIDCTKGQKPGSGCGVVGSAGEGASGDRGPVVCPSEGVERTFSCVFEGMLPAFDVIELQAAVHIEESAVAGEVGEVKVSGGGVPDETFNGVLGIGAREGFGVESYELRPEEEGGELTRQAGSHPFQVTGSVTLNQNAGAEPVVLPKELNGRLPAGLVGNPTPIAKCSLGQFLTTTGPLENECPLNTVVGVAMVAINEVAGFGIKTFVVPIFNVEPSVGEPARFGLIVPGVPVFLDPSVRTGGDYGITLGSTNISQTAALLSFRLTFWGVPGDPRHDLQRGIQCLEAERELPFASCHLLEEKDPPPLLSMPTSCAGPLGTSLEGASWAEPHRRLVFPGAPMQAMDGCNRLSFEPSIRTVPDGAAASTPTGLKVDVHVPQDSVLVANGLAEADVKSITVTLPEGMAVNPSSGDGRAVCDEEQVGFIGNEGETSLFTPTIPGVFCPDASKIATVTIHSPLLPNPLIGAVYLAEQDQNPFGSLFAMYLVASDPMSGTLVKLAGEVGLDSQTGRITTVFKGNPQLPFEDAEIHFFGGQRAPLATPARCGTYTTTATFTPWSGQAAVDSTDSFQITSGPAGQPCAGPALSFQPTVAAGSMNIQAGAFTPFTTTLSRADGQQDIRTVTLHMPDGLSGVLTGVKLCGEPEASQGACPPESLIGETIVSVGVGPDPYTVTGGRVYLTGPYEGAPFGLSIVNPVKAGPIDLAPHLGATEKACDCLVIRARLDVNRQTTALTVTTDAVPHILAGVPLQIQHVNVLINRRNFTFNPTNCNPLQISSSIESWDATTVSQTTPFQVTNCATLKFQPKLNANTVGKPTKLNGVGLNVKLTYPKGPFGSQANIASVKVQLPRLLPSRLETLQQACLAKTFEENPAGCPLGSKVGTAKAVTPLLPVPLTGDAYLVSHGGEAFPSLILLLHGYGVTVELVGTTFISKAGITTTTFKTTPDAPVESFEVNLPPGRYSALGTNGDICPHTTTTHQHHRTQRHTLRPTLIMPTTVVAQNGQTLKLSPHITSAICLPKRTKAKHGA